MPFCKRKRTAKIAKKEGSVKLIDSIIINPIVRSKILAISFEIKKISPFAIRKNADNKTRLSGII